MTDVTFRDATRDDIPTIVAMLADDALGATRESPDDLEPYLAGFDELMASGLQSIVVAEQNGAVVGSAQLTFLPGLSHKGMVRAQIEAVRVRADRRGEGIGSDLIKVCIERARERGAGLVQLTSHGSRTDAFRFYERLGFTGSHVGFKLQLEH